MFFFPRENQNLPREKTQNFAREKKACPWKTMEKNARENEKIAREILFHEN